MSSSRPDIELALDVRSYEKVVVVAGQDSTYDYPETWVQPSRTADLQVNGECVVIIDRVEIQRKTLAQIAQANPRLVAFAVASVDHEKQVRRMVTSLFPWNEVWTGTTVTRDVKVEGDRLIYTTRPAPFGGDGKMSVITVVWDKIK